MTVSHTQLPKVDAERVLYGRADTVDTLVRAAMLSMVEASIDMIIECEPEYQGLDSIKDSLATTNERTVDLIADLMDDLKASMIDRVRNMDAKFVVKQLTFDNDKLNDIVVDVQFD